MTDLILCPTRGGEASFPNQDRAIALAKDRDANILFLYITDVHFLDHFASAKIVDVEAEIDEMGEFLLAMAQERAQKAGVTANTIVRRGGFQQVLKSVLKEYPVKTIVLGSSEEGRGRLTLEYIHALGKEFRDKDGIEFIVVQNGEIKYTYQPG